MQNYFSRSGVTHTRTTQTISRGSLMEIQERKKGNEDDKSKLAAETYLRSRLKGQEAHPVFANKT